MRNRIIVVAIVSAMFLAAAPAHAVSQSDCEGGGVGCAWVSLTTLVDDLILKGYTYQMSTNTSYVNKGDRRLWRNGAIFWHDGQKKCTGCSAISFPDITFDCGPGTYSAETEGLRSIYRVDADVTLIKLS